MRRPKGWYCTTSFTPLTIFVKTEARHSKVSCLREFGSMICLTLLDCSDHLRHMEQGSKEG